MHEADTETGGAPMAPGDTGGAPLSGKNPAGYDAAQSHAGEPLGEYEFGCNHVPMPDQTNEV